MLLCASVVLIYFWHFFSVNLNKAFLPTPMDSFRAFIILLNEGVLLPAFFISLARVVVSSLIAIVFAIPIGILMGRVQIIDQLFSPFVSVLYPLPKIVFLPILVVLFGLGNLPKVILIALIIFFQILVVVRDASKSIPKESLLSMKSLSTALRHKLRYLIFPWILPEILTSLRISVGTAIAVLFFAETFASFDGLGFLILDGMERRDYASMYAAILAMALLGLILYEMLNIIETKFCQWKKIH